jgi:hypothetical protein
MSYVSAVKLVLEIRARDGKGHGELARVGRQLCVHPEGLRGRVEQAEIDNGMRPAPTTEDQQRIAEPWCKSFGVLMT